ncbi:MAG TPA: M50 family metallopeptidase, partial [Kiritimatiellia bacterium]|nr:M50 family metallopeptidase [Kiritimatiellia bacterium]
MLRSSYHLCTVFGIPIRLDASLIILMFLLIGNYGNPLYGIAAGIALLVSITLHELGHSLTAMAFGCRVRDITLMMMGGCATLLSMPRKAWQELLMAAAGPAVSLGMALAGLLLPDVTYRDGHVLFASGWDRFLFLQIGALNAML